MKKEIEQERAERAKTQQLQLWNVMRESERKVQKSLSDFWGMSKAKQVQYFISDALAARIQQKDLDFFCPPILVSPLGTKPATAAVKLLPMKLKCRIMVDQINMGVQKNGDYKIPVELSLGDIDKLNKYALPLITGPSVKPRFQTMRQCVGVTLKLQEGKDKTPNVWIDYLRELAHQGQTTPLESTVSVSAYHGVSDVNGVTYRNAGLIFKLPKETPALAEDVEETAQEEQESAAALSDEEEAEEEQSERPVPTKVVKTTKKSKKELP